MTEEEEFVAHSEYAHKVVSSWPAWKQNLLGRNEMTSLPTEPYPLPPDRQQHPVTQLACECDKLRVENLRLSGENAELTSKLERWKRRYFEATGKQE